MPSLRDAWRSLPYSSPAQSDLLAAAKGPYALPEPTKIEPPDGGSGVPEHRGAWRHLGRGLRAPFVAGLTLVLLAGMTVSVTLSEQPSKLLVRDSFRRADAGSWGTSDTGQRWLHRTDGSVDLKGSAGRLTIPGPGQVRQVVLADAHPAFVAIRFSFSLGRVPRAGRVRVGALARKTDSGSYRAFVRVGRKGDVSLSLSKARVGGTPRRIGPPVRLPWRYEAGQKVNVKVQVFDRNSTQLRIKAWRQGTAQPGWQLVGDDRANDIEAAGAVGLRAELSPSAAGSVRVRIDNVIVRRALNAARVAETRPSSRTQRPKAPRPKAPEKATKPVKEGLRLLGVDAIDIGQTDATVKWSLSDSATGFVRYGKTSSYGKRSTLEDSYAYSTHIQTLTDLEPGTRYHYAIVSRDATGAKVVSADRTFVTKAGAGGPKGEPGAEPTTEPVTEPSDDPANPPTEKPADPPSDEKAPTIISIKAVDVGTDRATIRWSLDEAATGQVEYGRTRGYGDETSKETSFAYTTHAQRVTDLRAGRTYHYRVISEDRAGNRVVSEDQTFITLDAPTAPTAPPTPTTAPTAPPTPTTAPTAPPTPTTAPTAPPTPTTAPTAPPTPTTAPTAPPTPTTAPTAPPTPTTAPTAQPTPTTAPTAQPTPTTAPTAQPTPTTAPTAQPTPTTAPTAQPTPTTAPTAQPTPTTAPTAQPTPTTAPTARPTPTTAPTAPAGTSGLYGPSIGGTSLNNTRIGYNDTQASYRFRADHSGRLESIRIYIIGVQAGYGAGTGGTLRITVRPDDGSAQHHPSGTILATRDVDRPTSGAGNRYTFPDPPTLTAGQLYHIVFTNVDPAPRQNYVSLDGVYQFDVSTSADPWQPGYDNTDWAQLVKSGSGAWSNGSGGVTTPIMQLEYADGTRQGMGYMEFWVLAPSQTKNITGTQHKARERITVAGGDRTVRSVTVRVKRVSGTGPLTIRLERGNGELIAGGTVAASRIAVSDPTDRYNDATWVTQTFPAPITLQSGSAYNLELSTDGSTTYNLSAIREGASYGYHPSTYFADGTAQETSNGGSTWQAPVAWSTRNSEGDWQFYFE